MRFLETLESGQRAAENIIKHDRRNQAALYALCADYALRSTYEFMLEKSWLSAARSGSSARGFCEEVRKLYPAFIDSYLVLGVFEYTAGSLSLPVRLLAAVGGLHGSKNKGIEYMARVAREGNYDCDAARVVLAVVARREKRPKDAAAILETLMTDYPRNYIFGWNWPPSTAMPTGQSVRSTFSNRSCKEHMTGSPGKRSSDKWRHWSGSFPPSATPPHAEVGVLGLLRCEHVFI